jgi:phosphotransacetylase
MRKTLEEKVALYKRAVINRKITAISSRLDGMGDVDKEKTDKLKAELVEAFGQLKDIKRI